MQIPKFDDSRLPVQLGNPLKVAHDAWSNWGILYKGKKEFDKLVRLSEEGYQQEWKSTCEQGHKEIALAAERAGLGDANTRLNQQNAQIVAELVTSFQKKVNILDVGAGAGATSTKIFELLEADDKERVFFLLLDPASQALQQAEEKLNKIGLRIGINYDVKIATDLEIPVIIKTQQHIVTAVAAIHHHAFLRKPFKIIYDVLFKNGFFITADWHNSMSENPAIVYELLSELDWPTKKKDLERFRKTFPFALQKHLSLNKENKVANDMIKAFWKEYSIVRKNGVSNFLILEGHRPAERYIQEMKKVGFKTKTNRILKVIPRNPFRILPHSSLLCVSIGQK